MEIREKLIALRENAQLSQMELADRVGVSRQTISRWESGTAVPATDNLKVLAEFYDISVDWLCSDSSTWPLPEAESSTATQPEPPHIRSHKARIVLFICAACLLLCVAIALALWALSARRANNTEVPIEDLVGEEVYISPESRFSLE